MHSSVRRANANVWTGQALILALQVPVLSVYRYMYIWNRNTWYGWSTWAWLVKLPLDEYHKISLISLYWFKLEQLERLHSEIPHAAPWLPMITHTSDPKSKQDKVKVINFKKLLRIQELYMQHTFWSCLIRCIIWNGSNKNCRCYRADTGCGMDGRTDRQMDGWMDRWKDRQSETNIPPTTSLCWGYNNDLVQSTNKPLSEPMLIQIYVVIWHH